MIIFLLLKCHSKFYTESFVFTIMLEICAGEVYAEYDVYGERLTCVSHFSILRQKLFQMDNIIWYSFKSTGKNIQQRKAIQPAEEFSLFFFGPRRQARHERAGSTEAIEKKSAEFKKMN